MNDSIATVTAASSPLPKYPAYKDSGEDWIAEIPEHWEVKKLKLIFKEKKIRHNPELNCGSISFGKVVIKDDEKIPLSTKASYQEVLKGEFLINPLNLNYDLISLRIALSEIDVVVSSGYIVLNNIIEIDKGYFKYLLHRYDVAYMKLLGSGVRQTISFNHIANSLLAFPPLSEQTGIAHFLDRKTAQVDTAIRIKEQQIELLKERRQILIHKAVTQGLNPEVPMKDSGVDWIGEIPAHWKIIKLKFWCKFIDGDRGPNYPSGNDIIDEGIPFLSSKNINNFKFNLSKLDFISENKFKKLGRGKVQRNDIVITVRGSIGNAAFFTAEKYETAFINAQMMILRAEGELLPETLHQLTQCKYWEQQLNLLSYGSAQQQLSAQILKNINIALPPLIEQEQILNHNKDVSSKIDIAIFSKEKEIEKLKEYKATLINSAVTGKMKVG